MNKNIFFLAYKTLTDLFWVYYNKMLLVRHVNKIQIPVVPHPSDGSGIGEVQIVTTRHHDWCPP